MTISGKISDFVSTMIGKPRVLFDPAIFNDPLAKATLWTPAMNGGASFCTHRLRKTDQMCVEFKATFGAKLFCSFFSGMGALFAMGPAAGMYNQYHGFNAAMLPFSLFGLLFFGIGILLYYYVSQPIVFDRKRNCFVKGRIAPGDMARRKGSAIIDMGRIHALQVLSEYCHGDKSSYYSYELNLVLDDASRVNVVDHGNLAALRQDAATLGSFLGVPVWDAEAVCSGNLVKDTGGFPDKWGVS